jgi:hypothetical protein
MISSPQPVTGFQTESHHSIFDLPTIVPSTSYTFTSFGQVFLGCPHWLPIPIRDLPLQVVILFVGFIQHLAEVVKVLASERTLENMNGDDQTADEHAHEYVAEEDRWLHISTPGFLGLGSLSFCRSVRHQDHQSKNSSITASKATPAAIPFQNNGAMVIPLSNLLNLY